MLRGFSPYYHPGIERRKIFRDNRDRENLLEWLEKLLREQRRDAMPGHFFRITPAFFYGQMQFPSQL